MPTPTPAEDEDETKSRSSAPAFLLSVHQHGRTSLDIDIDETSEDIILLLIGICFGADRHQPYTAVSTNLGTPNQPSKEPKSGKAKQSKMLIAAFKKKAMRDLKEQRILQQEERLNHRFLERGTQY
nr:hypothetical protein I308_06089 [Cryptococcus tetragattii IND107]